MRTSAHRGVRLRVTMALVVLSAVVLTASEAPPFVPVDQLGSSWPVSRIVTVPVLPVEAPLLTGHQTVAGAVAGVEAAAAHGASGIRVTAALSWLCPTPSCSTSPLDPIIAKADAAGLQVYLHVNGTPAWMDGRGPWFPPLGADAEVWAALFGQLVARYGTTVTAYEVWNEPNLYEFWRTGPDAGAYADLLKAAWVRAHEVNPGVTIVGAVLSNNDLGYMSELSEALRERGGNVGNRFFYDLLGVHPYAGGRGIGYNPRKPAGSADVHSDTGPKDMTFLGVDRLREQVAHQEGIWRDVVIGEFGYDTTPGSWYHVPEPRRARYLSIAVQLADERPWIRSFSVYSYSGDPADGFSIQGTPSEQAVLAVG